MDTSTTSSPKHADRRAARDPKKMEEDAEPPRHDPGQRKPPDHLAKSSFQPRNSAQQLHKQAKQPQPTKDIPYPNYMKPTMNAKARKETKHPPLSKEFGVSAHKPQSHETKHKTQIHSRSPSKASRRNLRPSRRVILEDVSSHENGHTCGHTSSSNLKDVAFPQKLEVTRAGKTAKKVCPYSCCSLNALENLPPVKHPFLRRKVSIKPQKSIRVRGVPSSFSRKRGVRRVEKKSAGATTRHTSLHAESSSAASESRKRGVRRVQRKSTTGKHVSPNLTVEKHGLETTIRGASALNSCKNGGFFDGKDGDGSDQITAPDTTSIEEQTDYESELSDSEKNVIRDFLEALESDEESTPTGTKVDEVKKGRKGWLLENSILNELSSSTTDGDYELPGTNPFLEHDASEKPTVREDRNELGDSVEDRDESDTRAEKIINEAQKYIEMELEFPEEEEECLPSFECQSEEEYLNNDIQLFLEDYLPSCCEIEDKNKSTDSVMEDSMPSSKTKGKLETRLSIKKNLIKKCFEKLRTIRKLTRASFLPTVEETDQRKFELARMMVLDQKNVEEWKLDYKLRLLVDQLAKARKKKVELLVEAYESVIPKATKA